MTWQLRFWGVRGSVPSPGPRTARFGGNTPCLELRGPDGDLVILDAGTGLREFGSQLSNEPMDLRIFLTHGHWDHIQGLPFFAPLFRSGTRITIHGPRPESGAGGLARAFDAQMSAVVFPVALADAGATVEFREFSPDDGRFEGPGYEITTMPVRHPGGAVGYSFSMQGRGDERKFVYVSDNELTAEGDLAETDAWRRRLVEFASDADLLVHDATYSEQEYGRHRGWGHSTDRQAVALALEAGVKRLALFHHHPDRSDAEIDSRTEDCRRVVRDCGSRLEVFSAAEGSSLTL